jgi:hypothetical protein
MAKRPAPADAKGEVVNMRERRPAPADAKGKVVNMRERAAGRIPRSSATREATSSPVGDLKRYEQSSEKDDYRHRMITNLLALAFLVLLVIGGIWIADTMATMRKNQDCVLSGRRGCTPVDAPLPQRW